MNQVCWQSRALCTGLLLFGLFALTAFGVQTASALTQLDAALLQTTRQLPANTSQPAAFVRALTSIGGVWLVFGVSGVGMAWLLCLRRYSLALAWMTALLGAYVLTEMLKSWIARPRPPDATTSGWSFPSGHALRSLVGYGFVAYVVWHAGSARWLRVLALCVVGLLVAGVGFSRVYLGEHYPSDVFGSWLIGGAWLCLLIGLTCSFRVPLK